MSGGSDGVTPSQAVTCWPPRLVVALANAARARSTPSLRTRPRGRPAVALCAHASTKSDPGSSSTATAAVRPGSCATCSITAWAAAAEAGSW